MNTSYHINELFTSIDGEVNTWHQGRPSFFIRMQGCNLKCPYCDTKPSQSKNQKVSKTISEIYKQYVLQSKPMKITITGGEPLLQDITPLAEFYINEKVRISIETNGTIECRKKWVRSPNVSFIIDIKLPSSGCLENKISWRWIEDMKKLPNTWLKFVVKDKKDLAVAHRYIASHKLPISKCAFSPIFGIKGVIKPAKLFKWMMQNDLTSALLNVQIHKVINLK